MPLSIVCGSCEAKLNAPDAAAGKRVKCPKCGVLLEIPRPEPKPNDDFEVIDDQPKPVIKSATPSKTKPKPMLLDEDDDRPALKKKSKPMLLETDDDDDRPRKKKSAKATQDDEFDAPRPKKKSKGKQPPRKSKLPLIIGGSAGGVIVLALVVWLAFLKGGSGTAANGTNTPGQPGTGGGTGGAGTETLTDPTTGATRFQPTARFKLPTRFKNDPLPTFSDDGQLVALNSWARLKTTGTVWDLSGEPKQLALIEDRIRLTPDGRAVYRQAFGGDELLDLSSKKVIAKPDTGAPEHTQFISPTSYVCSPRSYDFATATSGKITVRDLLAGSQVSFAIPDNRFGRACFTDGGKKAWLFMSYKKFEVECWDVPGRRLLKTIRPQALSTRPYTNSGTGCSVSADGAVITSNHDRQRFYDANTGALLSDLPELLDGSTCGFSPFGQLYVARVKESQYKYTNDTALYDFKAKKVLAVFTVPKEISAEPCTYLSPDGKRAICALPAVGEAADKDPPSEVLVYDISSLNLK